MSADEVFAAQMWAWPGPMLKRDAAGRVIIVNGAFLQLYGGRVEDWAGNAVTGWPAPQPAGHSTRFESRMPLQDGSEIIYDWIECTMADGTALAIARDVTAFMQAPQPAAAPQPAQAQATQNHSQPVEQQPSAQEQVPAQAAVQAQTHAQEYVQEAAVAPQAETAPVVEAPEPTQQPVAQQLMAQQQAAAYDDTLVSQIPEDPMDEHMATQAPAEQLVDSQQLDDIIDSSPAQSASFEREERDFERRALPIESGDAVLGNNWRDAVIAKAVGNEEAADFAEPIATEEEAPVTKTDGVRILLAEDNAINALLTRTLLEAEGCVVDVVEDGQLAVEAVRKAPYDMIFMDMRMPNMDGLEATRKIRGMDHMSKGLPIVALTANAFDDDRNACFDSGMNDFMTKPVSAEELSQMVKVHAKKTEEVAA